MEVTTRGVIAFTRLGIEHWRVQQIESKTYTTPAFNTPVGVRSDGQTQRHTYYPAGKHTKHEAASFSVTDASWMIVYSHAEPLMIYFLGEAKDTTLTEVLLALHAIMSSPPTTP
ncbi:MAG TPA: hypothetical protein VK502_01825 [Candidatus Saccharimonadales bacterium]|nr:hypothetical protein [Candidatus Saccharimonadales bacterium]